MQCSQYVFYSLLSLQKQRVCVKGHQNNLQTSKIIPRRGRAPWFLNSWIRHCFIFSNIFDITINFTNRENRNHVNYLQHFYSSLDDAFGRTCVCCVVTLHSLRIASVINIIIFVFTEKQTSRINIKQSMRRQYNSAGKFHFKYQNKSKTKLEIVRMMFIVTCSENGL